MLIRQAGVVKYCLCFDLFSTLSIDGRSAPRPASLALVAHNDVSHQHGRQRTTPSKPRKDTLFQILASIQSDLCRGHHGLLRRHFLSLENALSIDVSQQSNPRRREGKGMRTMSDHDIQSIEEVIKLCRVLYTGFGP
jgi:hypothetical protein